MPLREIVSFHFGHHKIHIKYKRKMRRFIVRSGGKHLAFGVKKKGDMHVDVPGRRHHNSTPKLFFYFTALSVNQIRQHRCLVNGKLQRYGNNRCTLSTICLEVKGKAIPLQAWTGPKGSRRLRLPFFKKIGI
jgi:hypothetical protein